ncbi:MAG: MarR family transcriptional regulator [Thiobacillus sp.]
MIPFSLLSKMPICRPNCSSSTVSAARTRRVRQFTFSYASPELLFSEISPKRWDVLEAMSGAGEMSPRELARRLARDVKSVHRDVHALLETGLLEKTESGKIICPFDKVRVDFTLAQAA